MWGRSRRQSCGIICLCLLVNGLLYVIYANYIVTSTPGIAPHSGAYDFSDHRPSLFERMMQIKNSSDRQVELDGTFIDRQVSLDTTPALGVDPHDYPYLINEPDLCSKDGGYVRLIVVVTCAMGNFEQRNAVRDTWGSFTKQKDFGVRLVFLVGFIQNLHQQKQLQRESMKHHDIVQVDFHDSYRNLTIKSVAMMKWVSTYCANARYALKSDDDMYINVPQLLQALDAVKHSRFFLCSMQYGARPIRDKKSKWYVLKKEFSEKIYPNYCSGTAYSFSVSVSADLFLMATKINLFWLEDVFISGLLPRHVPLKHVHNPKFEYWKNSLARPCHYKRLITSHKMNPKELRRIWRVLKRPLRC